MKNLLVKKPENPPKLEAEEEGSEDEPSDHEEEPSTDKGKEPEHEQECEKEHKDTSESMDTRSLQLQEVEY